MAKVIFETDKVLTATINGVDCKISFNNSSLGYPYIDIAWTEIRKLNKTRIAIEKITGSKMKT